MEYFTKNQQTATMLEEPPEKVKESVEIGSTTIAKALKTKQKQRKQAKATVEEPMKERTKTLNEFVKKGDHNQSTATKPMAMMK